MRYPDLIKNVYRVPSSSWKRWSLPARCMFNQMFKAVRDHQHLFRHPRSKVQATKHWETTAFNTAWVAADLLMGRDTISNLARKR